MKRESLSIRPSGTSMTCIRAPTLRMYSETRHNAPLRPSQRHDSAYINPHTHFRSHASHPHTQRSCLDVPCGARRHAWWHGMTKTVVYVLARVVRSRARVAGVWLPGRLTANTTPLLGVAESCYLIPVCHPILFHIRRHAAIREDGAHQRWKELDFLVRVFIAVE